jgi:4-hydroxy-3-polyprenylbenzoate decarboxylase
MTSQFSKMSPMTQLFQPENVTVAITGASGAVFTVHLLQALEADKRVKAVNLIVSDTALRVLAEEIGIRGRSGLPAQLLGTKSKKIQQQNNDDIAANVASGSYPTDAMIVIPCSMGTLARIANGMSSSLIERAADVCLKEQRPLILCARETPLNKIHIRNMYRAADAGAVIYPLIPTFYNKPMDSSEMARQFAARVLQHIGLPQTGAYRWKG